MDNPVVHFEVLGPNGPELREFYAELFGWRLRPIPMPGYADYGFLPAPEGPGIGGGVGSVDGQRDSFVTVFVEVDDIQSMLDRAGRLGAMTVLAPTEIPGVGVIARFRDPHGAVIGLVKPSA